MLDKTLVGHRSGIESLSPREREVLEGFANGWSNVEIGRRLFIERRTVESFSRVIYDKLGISYSPKTNSRARAVALFLRGDR